MSYYARIGGYLKISPPLKWSEIRNSEFFPDTMASTYGPSIALYAEREDVETDEGVSTLITSNSAGPVTDTDFDCRNLGKDVESLASVMKELGHQVEGVLIVQPRDYGDGGIWRVISDADGVRKEFAKLQWPDGSEVELP